MKSKQPFGYQKRKKRKPDEENRKVDVGVVDKFIHRQPFEEHTEENVEEHIKEHVEENIKEQEHVEVEETEEHEPVKDLVDIYDLRRWEKLNSDEIKFFIEKGPKEITVLLVKFLAKHNLAFHGSNDKLYKKGNGNFFGVIEMLEEFDPVIKEHVQRITSEGLHVHYLGHLIQNELISLLAEEIKKELIKKIKKTKYHSIKLDCFLNVDDTSGKGLFDITLEVLNSLGLQINDMRGQGYDNGENMKGKHQGDVRESLLQVGEKDYDVAIASEAMSLAEKELSDFEFLVSTVVWYEVLNHVNIESKKLQSKDMHLDNAITEINKLIGHFKDH
ncbi:uncharacterized protein LOC111885130 [Lactuca sativa]|uniref:uncharacterized protein LOC111885130 n=1 Tax=Lactuca sativa TaxID=4236 RepID=UPI000CD841FD|nr:uncharacterized protein LOC111885130 [Lactuca sativa]